MTPITPTHSAYRTEFPTPTTTNTHPITSLAMRSLPPPQPTYLPAASPLQQYPGFTATELSVTSTQSYSPYEQAPPPPVPFYEQLSLELSATSTPSYSPYEQAPPQPTSSYEHLSPELSATSTQSYSPYEQAPPQPTSSYEQLSPGLSATPTSLSTPPLPQKPTAFLIKNTNLANKDSSTHIFLPQVLAERLYRESFYSQWEGTFFPLETSRLAADLGSFLSSPLPNQASQTQLPETLLIITKADCSPSHIFISPDQKRKIQAEYAAGNRKGLFLALSKAPLAATDSSTEQRGVKRKPTNPTEVGSLPNRNSGVSALQNDTISQESQQSVQKRLKYSDQSKKKPNNDPAWNPGRR